MAGAFQNDAFQESAFQEDPSGVTAADSPTTSDSASRVLTLVRTASDTTTTSDTARHGGGAFQTDAFQNDAFQVDAAADTFSASDTVTTSDSATRVLSLLRTATDAPTTSDAATRIASLSRSTSDAPTLSDAATASLIIIRTAADTRTTSDTATRALTLARSAAQTITTSSTAARTGSLLRSTADTVTFNDGVGRYLGLAVPIDTTTETPVLRYHISITVDGTDITDDVEIEEASFVSMVNGYPGSCLIKVRDPNRDKSFTIGKRINLDIAGNRVWTGYLTAQKRAYVFDAYNPATRVLILEGADINVLFHKRFVFSQSTPTKMLGPTYGVLTKDITAIHDLIAGWLDLSGDSLNTGAYVENIGNVNVNQKANLWQAGWDWASAMATIARLTQAIFYIDPDRHLVYTDVDSPTAPYGLTDAPGGEGVGYRELELLHDGAQLVNDALVWGFGGGSSTPVFSRLESSSSETSHGRWQFGATYSALYKQATADKITDSIINGSPLSKRGGKSDRVSVNLTTFTPGFIPAQKVTFTSHAFGFSDVIPIRRMAVTFPSGVPRYALTLSHEIDQPFNLIDIIPIPGVNTNFPPIGGIGEPPPPTGEECECGITDTFTRTVAGGWGTSDSTLAWTIGSGTAARLSVDGSSGVFSLNVSGDSVNANLTTSLADAMTLRTSFVASSLGTGSDSLRVTFSLVGTGSFVRAWFGTGVGDRFLTLESGGEGIQHDIDYPWVAGVVYNLRWDYLIGDYGRLRIWAATDPEPSTWDIEASDVGNAGAFSFLSVGFDGTGATGRTLKVDDLDISTVNKCTENRFDNFNRTVVSGSWGTSDFGSAWSRTGGTATPSVNGSAGVIACNSSFATMTATPPSMPLGFIQTGRFSFTSLPTLNKRIFLDTPASGGWTIKVGTGNPITSDGGFIGIAGGGTSPQIVFPPNSFWSTSAKYRWQWVLAPGALNQLSVWRENDPGTVYTVNQVTPIAATPSGIATFDIEADFFASNILIDWIDFDYDGKPCFVGGGPATPATDTPATRTCTTLTTDGSTTIFYVTGGYEAGSLEVYLNGLRQSYGTDYTESSAGVGEFTMTIAPAGVDELYVCYRYISPTGGGGGQPGKLS